MRSRLTALAVMLTCISCPLVCDAQISSLRDHDTSPSVARHDVPPRKVIVGTMMTPWWGPYPGVPQRIEQMCALIDEVANQSQEKFQRTPDLILFPEYALVMGNQGDVAEYAVQLEGAVLDAFAAKAKQYQTYIVLGGIFSDGASPPVCRNEAIFLDRNGALAGRYAKVHPVANPTVEDGQDSLEGGVQPGRTYNVINCDFGRVGVQICYDVEYPEGWARLGEQQVDLVLFPTASPQLTRPAGYAAHHNYWVVSATPRTNASIFEPGTGSVAAQITGDQRVLAHEIDLSYLVLPWSPMLQNGKALADRYGDQVGFHYSESEDRGVFWSNDPNRSIGSMARDTDLLRTTDKLERSRRMQDQQRPGPIE